MLKPPTLASIGTVLIDVFDKPPHTFAQNPTFPQAVPVRNASNIDPLSKNGTPTPQLAPPTEHSPQRATSNPVHHLFHSSPNDDVVKGVVQSSSVPAAPKAYIPNSHVVPISKTNTPGPSGSYETLGGGGLYAIVGARIWLPPQEMRILIDRAPRDNSKISKNGISGHNPNGIDQTPTNGATINGKVDYGDFPKELENRLMKLGSEMWVFNEGPSTRTPRARIGYQGDVRTFEHLVPPPTRTIASLLDTPLQNAEYLHVVSAPSEIARLHAEILSIPPKYNFTGTGKPWRPKIVFEPHPMFCGPDQREWLEKVAGFVEILSPNHEELLSLFSLPKTPLSDPKTIPVIQSLIHHLLSLGIGQDGNGTVVVRCGRHGACVATRQGGLRWVPAYFHEDEQELVRDVTGAGNAFLGGFVAGLTISQGDPYQATLYATVSASFIVEQPGLPVLTPIKSGDRERWNDEIPIERLKRLRREVMDGSDGSSWC